MSNYTNYDGPTTAFLELLEKHGVSTAHQVFQEGRNQTSDAMWQAYRLGRQEVTEQNMTIRFENEGLRAGLARPITIELGKSRRSVIQMLFEKWGWL